MTVSEDAQTRYEVAKARRERLLEEWERLGKPVLVESSRTGRPLPHPLLRALNDVDVLCARLERELRGPARVGRPSGATSAPDRAAPPKVRKLRSA